MPWGSQGRGTLPGSAGGGTLPGPAGGGVPWPGGVPWLGGYPGQGGTLAGGYPPPGGVPWLGGLPWPGGTLAGGVPCRGGTQLGQHMEYLLHGGRYASCVHAGGLSCLFVRLPMSNKVSAEIWYWIWCSWHSSTNLCSSSLKSLWPIKRRFLICSSFPS